MLDTLLLERKLEQYSSEYYQLYKKLKAWAISVWSDYTDIPEQIRHGISHSEKVAEYADIILQKKLRPVQ